MARPATSRLKVNPPLGSPPTLEWRAVGELLIDPVYQRSIDTGPSQSLIRRIAMFWDWGLCQPLAVSRRPDGALTIVDGQHRAAAAKLRGDIPHLPCVITSYSNAGDEAAAFVALNQQRRPLGALDLFKAALVAGDTEATAIMEAIEQAGLTLAPHMTAAGWKAGMIGNVGGLFRYFRRYGIEAVRASLGALARTWPGDVLRYAGTLYPGFAVVAADELRLRSSVPEIIERLSAIARGRSQAEWRRLIQSAVADAGGSQRESAELVFRAHWRERHRPAVTLPTKGEPQTHALVILDPGEIGWCDQCQRKVSGERAAKCTDRFCSLRKAEAA